MSPSTPTISTTTKSNNDSSDSRHHGDQSNTAPLSALKSPLKDEASFATSASSTNAPTVVPTATSNHHHPPTMGTKKSDVECQKCMTYLTRALNKAGSRPQFLLRALGVVSRDETTVTSDDNNSNSSNSNYYYHDGVRKVNYGAAGVEALKKNNNNNWYTRTEDGNGFVVNLRRHDVVVNADDAAATVHRQLRAGTDNGSTKNDVDNVKNQVGGIMKENVTVKQSSDDKVVSSEDAASNSKNEKQQQQQQQNQQHANIVNSAGMTSLRRKLTTAAQLLVGGNNRSMSDAVLTTSPSLESNDDASTTAASGESSPFTTVTIECQTCGTDTRAEAGARAYVRGPVPLSIVLCSNRLSSQREVDEVLIHELMHVFDVHSRQMDLRDCRQLAYSEIRAAREAECSNSLTSFTTNICVKDKATIATKNMFPEEGRKCVCDVFDKAIHDLAPFVENGQRYAAFNNKKSVSNDDRAKKSAPFVNQTTPSQINQQNSAAPSQASDR